MWNLYLSLLKQLVRMEKQQELQQDLKESIAEVQRQIDLIEEVLSWRLPPLEGQKLEIPRQYGFLVAKEFHNVNPFEGRILWSR